MMMVVAALIGSVFVISAVAGAAKPDLTAKAVARAQCKAEKQADKAAFKATYKSDMGTCINGAKEESADELKNASQECRAERDADEALFNETYGTNKNGKNAFGKCVSGKVKTTPDDDETEEDDGEETA
jgi:fatty acid-binding protein DegV